MARFDVTTFGEGQLRYSVPIGTRLENVSALDVHSTGTEANVMSLLSSLGWNTGWVSALPNSPLGRRFVNDIKPAGVDVSAVQWVDDARIATYYVEYATAPRSTQVYYDRANTAFIHMDPDEVDWDYLLDSRLLHISGLTLPLSPSITEIMHQAVERAKAKGVPISFDMNYRSRIWTPEQAQVAIEPIIKQVDVLFFARGDVKKIYGVEGDHQTILNFLAQKTDATHIVVSLSTEGILGWDRQQMFHVPARKVDVLDRIGAGDAMVGGVLHGWLQGEFFKGLKYGALTAALALTQYGDQVITTTDELKELVNTADGGDIIR